ncbi:hypothetical protein FRC01_003120, partial [Tulasnella sp. 417]
MAYYSFYSTTSTEPNKLQDRMSATSAPADFSYEPRRQYPSYLGYDRIPRPHKPSLGTLNERLSVSSNNSGHIRDSGILAPLIAGADYLLQFRDDHGQIFSSPTAKPRTSVRPVSILLPYSEDIPPMKEEEVAHMPWVAFIAVADQLGGRYRPRSGSPAAYGGFSDIWQCDAIFSCSTAVVAVKKLRAVRIPQGSDKSQTSKRLLKRLKRELKVWMRLKHPNIAPLLGFTFNQEIAIISPWFTRGNLSEYLAKHPEADRMKLIEGVAAGLGYLHSSTPTIIHGDIKPEKDNVLIDKEESPRITDFGLSKIVEEDHALSSLRSASLRDAGNSRWIAPELLLEE